MSEQGILELTEENFDEHVAKTREPILVDFWASWCAPCKLVAPTLEQLAEELEGQAQIGKVNVEENGDLATRFAIRSIPTLILFKEGQAVERIVGFMPKEKLLSKLTPFL